MRGALRDFAGRQNALRDLRFSRVLADFELRIRRKTPEPNARFLEMERVRVGLPDVAGVHAVAAASLRRRLVRGTGVMGE